ncbi:unnamed protein product [Adineta ricciae]|uniref:Uncharacterized protein n=1 Tax=Adineta ricciae TaxID=249248 RepID=A0A814M332_ADIRI|nr:unnamed protein product [Adineta ricciae]
MFSRRNQSSTEEEVSDEDTTSSSNTSDATSKTTTSDSWHEAKSDIEQHSRGNAEKNQSVRKVIKPLIDDDDDATDRDVGNNDTDHDEALIKAVNDIYINSDTQTEVENKLTTENTLPIENKSKQQTEKQEWVNPYWGPISKTVITTTRTTVNEQIDSSNAPCFVPGANAPADQNKLTISAQRKKQDSGDFSHRSDDSFHTTEKCPTDDGMDQDDSLTLKSDDARSKLLYSSSGYQRLKETDSSDEDDIRIASLINKPNVASDEVSIDTKPWVNPYWSTANQGDGKVIVEKRISTTSSNPSYDTQKDSSIRSDNFSSLLAPIDSNPSTDSSLDARPFEKPSINIEKDLPWVNPYWKTERVTTETSSKGPNESTDNLKLTENEESRIEDKKPWENPYWKESKLSSLPSTSNDDKKDTSETSRKEEIPWENPYWKDKASSVFIISKPHLELVEKPDVKDDKPWENPYWKDKSSTISTLATHGNKLVNNSNSKQDKKEIPQSVVKEETPWENPYWKTKASPNVTTLNESNQSAGELKIKDNKLDTSMSTNKDDSVWKNPYWQESKSTTETSTGKESESKSNVISGDSKPVLMTSTKQEEKPWENPYWKNKSAAFPRSLSQPDTLVSASTLKDSIDSKKVDTPWENPYWKEKHSSSKLSDEKKEAEPWENPYWKNKTAALPRSLSQLDSTDSKKEDKPWENPYWKEQKVTTSVAATMKKDAEPWKNPYWTDKETSSPLEKLKPQDLEPSIPTEAKQEAKPWENPYWKNRSVALARSQSQPDASISTSQSKDLTDSKKEDEPWENPYWKEHKATAPAAASVKREVEPWKNPYWTEKQISTSLKNPQSENLKSSLLTQTNKEEKPWVNPYWKEDKTAIPVATNDKKEETPWENPYWRNKSAVVSRSLSQPDVSIGSTKLSDAADSKKEEKPWVNPYWKDHKAAAEKVTSIKEEAEPWKNPYWNDDAIGKSTATKQKQQTSWENPYWKSQTSATPAAVKKEDKSTNTTTDDIMWRTADRKTVTTQTSVSLEQPETVTSKSTAPDQSTCPKLQVEPWQNPYWKDQPVTSVKPAKEAQTPWENPYWKNQSVQETTSFKQDDKSAENLDFKPIVSEAVKSTEKEPTPWQNPYWKDQPTANAKSSAEVRKPWENPYWKDKPIQPALPAEQDNTARISEAAKPDQAEQAPWKSPYWKDDKYKVIHSDNQSKPAKQENIPWVNPYWKDNNVQPKESSKQPDEPWQNPYWKNTVPQTTTTPSQQPSPPRENSYSNVKMPDNSVVSAKATEPSKNPHWADSSTTTQKAPLKENTLQENSNTASKYAENKRHPVTILNDTWIIDNDSPPDHAVPPIPSFYKRIYPPETAPSSLQPKSTASEEARVQTPDYLSQLRSTPVHSEIQTDRKVDYYPPQTDRKVDYYCPQTAYSPVPVKQTSQFTTSPPFQSTRTLSPSPPPFSSNIPQPPAHDIHRAASPTRNDMPLAQYTNLSSSIPPPQPIQHQQISISSTLVSPSELHDIQKALRCLDLGSDSIITIEKTEFSSTGRIIVAEVPYAVLNSVVIDNKKYRSQEYPGSFSTFDSQNNQYNSLYSQGTASYPKDLSDLYDTPDGFVHI